MPIKNSRAAKTILAISILGAIFIFTPTAIAYNLIGQEPHTRPIYSPSPTFDKIVICEVIEISATLPVITSRKVPEYPKLARDYRIGGRVDVMAIVLEDGSVGDVRILRGNPVLAEAARKATLGWRFRAGMENGARIKSEVPITFNFKLE